MHALAELLLELLYDGIFEGLVSLFIRITEWLVPKKSISDKAKRRVRRGVTAVTCLVLGMLLTGLLFLMTSLPALMPWGNGLALTSLGLIGLLILGGVVTKIIEGRKK
ncbi:MAG: hypothetical protein IKC69_05205 [Clostridia bacterium]|nr:hypothetical protein [Clostridia bacterium]